MTDEDKDSEDLIFSNELEFPPTDETGDVDISLLECNLMLTPAGRLRQHMAAAALVEALRTAVEKQRARPISHTQTPGRA